MKGVGKCVTVVLIALSSTYAFQNLPLRPNFNRRNLDSRSKVMQKCKSTSSVDTTLDETVDSPASVLFYDDVLDDDIPDGVVCARGVCVVADDEDSNEIQTPTDTISPIWKARATLGFASILYGTNFPLGALMNDSLPASAATSSRMVLAAVALSPFLPRLEPSMVPLALLCGCFTATGYIAQSLALVDTSPSTVAFLGAVTVIVCPILEAVVNKRQLGVSQSPQTWLAAALCLTGVGVLEFTPGEVRMASVTMSIIPLLRPCLSLLSRVQAEGSYLGDALAVLQAVGFGTSFFLTEKLMRGKRGMALPVTAVQVSVSAFLCGIWCVVDPSGWLFEENNYSLAKMIFDPDLSIALYAVLWTGLVTTAANRLLETISLGKLASAEASVILATEPLFAALFASLLLNETFGKNDYVGGALIVLACVSNTLTKESPIFAFLQSKDETT